MYVKINAIKQDKHKRIISLIKIIHEHLFENNTMLNATKLDKLKEKYMLVTR